MMDMRRTALFDLDGTLTDPRVGITACVARALEAMGVVVPSQQELDTWIGPPLYDSFFDYLRSRSLAEEALQHYRDRFSRVGMYENERYPGIDEMLGSVATQVESMFVVTSKPRVYANTIVQHFGLEAFFDGVYGSEFDGSLTDKSELIAHVLRSESIAADDATMIGDRRHDIVGAHSNSVRSIGVLWGYGSRQELEDAGAHQICEAVLELPQLLVAG